jgi:hypothetical protein
MSTFQKQVLQYVHNTGGGATKVIFFDDFDPVGPRLWATYFDDLRYITVDSAGKLWLTTLGKQQLAKLQ